LAGFIKDIRNRLFPPEPQIDELVLDIKLYNNEIKRVQKSNEKKANEMREKAKEELKRGNEPRVKMYMNQHMKAKSAAFSLDMFTITMEGLIFDLQNASSLQNMGVTMGKINKTLEKLGILKISDVSKMMGQVNRSMSRMGIAMDTVYNSIDNYEPFSVESYSQQDIDKEINLLSEEVLAETGTLPETVSDLMEKREKLDEK
jgi:hypothetical protein